MKRKPWKREVRYLYLMLLKKNDRIININKSIGYYNDYDSLIESWNDADFPEAIKASIVFSKKGTIIPKYLQWAKKFLIKEVKK